MPKVNVKGRFLTFFVVKILSEQAAPAPSRDALLELLGDVMRAQETKPDELKAKQQRLLVIAPTEVGPNELAGIVRESMDNW